ncbi:glycerophosphodiester phosphodiesterase family protein [Dactylosporangium sp. CA-233914]|uniref:glycerophosphodiester phosphodiesterase family protein n=1 Tax=Dactylosporangium sp. CA-233914 TaxID=3239934 RepID=UPI003D94C582
MIPRPCGISSRPYTCRPVSPRTDRPETRSRPSWSRPRPPRRPASTRRRWNTLPSLRAAFAAKIDVQLTSDGRLAVFHDATLQCRTDGTGTVGEHTLTELRELDLRWSWSATKAAGRPASTPPPTSPPSRRATPARGPTAPTSSRPYCTREPGRGMY